MKPTSPQRHILQMLADGALIYVPSPEHYQWASGHTIARSTMNALIRNGWVEMTVGGTLGAASVAYTITNAGREVCGRTPVCDNCGETEPVDRFNGQDLCAECWEIAYDYEQQLLMDEIA